MSYLGLNGASGAAVDGLDHLRQSVRDILATPLNSRVMRRDYGSALHDLVDGNLDGLTLAKIYAATADALARWEPRLRVTRVELAGLPASLEQGRIEITVHGDYLPEGRELRIDGIIL